VAAYLRRQSEARPPALTSFEDRTGNRSLLFTSFRVEDEAGLSTSSVLSGQDVTLVFGYRSPDGPMRKAVNVGFGLHAATGERLTILYASHTGQEFHGLPESGEFRCRVRRFPFNPGRYWIYPRIEVNQVEADFPRGGVGYFDVEAGDFYRTGRSTTDQSVSPFLIDGDWAVGLAPEAARPATAVASGTGS
jgi:hypothetical protein